MKYFFFLVMPFVLLLSCSDISTEADDEILGYNILNDLCGHWVGSNLTAFGIFDWFAFDFRPISASHVHSIYEGGLNQNIITSVFIADFEGKLQVMARNGGWLGSQYRATYYVMDRSSENQNGRYYRLVDAVGGQKRSYIEFSFVGDSIHIDAYKDNSGALDEPILHMGFSGRNQNPRYSESAKSLFDFPQQVSEVDLNDRLLNLIDPDSALFLEEQDDPFPKSEHGYVSDLTTRVIRTTATIDSPLLLFISKEILVSGQGIVDIANVNNSVVRTIDVQATEDSYTTTYLHPDNYYVTVFYDQDGNGIPSAGESSSVSFVTEVEPETTSTIEVELSLIIQ